MDYYYYDTESLGFTGPVSLIQYQKNDEEPVIFQPWHETVNDNLSLIETMMEGTVVGFNLAHDHFHLQKWYNMLEYLKNDQGGESYPINHVNLLAELEPEARFGQCVKPNKCFDLMLHARKGPYQALMDRKEIRLRRVPSLISYDVRNYLEVNITFPDIYFSRAKKDSKRWKIYPIVNRITNQTDPEFVDIVLHFSASTSLKAIVIDAGLREDRLYFKDMELVQPVEIPYAPWAKAISEGPYWSAKVGSKKGSTWPGHVSRHVAHWSTPKGMKYALEDVEDTRSMYDYFGRPEANDDDSVIACLVGSNRWRGFPLNVDHIKVLKAKALEESKLAPIGAKQVYTYLEQVMDADELEFLKDRNGKPSTKRTIIEGISNWTKECDCGTTRVEKISVGEGGFGGEVFEDKIIRIPDPNCKECIDGIKPHPAALRAKLALTARQATTKKALYNKLIKAKRLHPAASVIGSLSGRVSGRTEGGSGEKISSINALGIQRDKQTRMGFKMFDDGFTLSAGDFDAFEVAIAEAAYDDVDLRTQLLTCNECQYEHTPDEYRTVVKCPQCSCAYTACSVCNMQIVVNVLPDGSTNIKTPCSCEQPLPYKGYEGTFRKIHALFAMELFPGNSYNDILSTKGTTNDLYVKGKNGIFGGILYGGDENTLESRIGIPIEQGLAARNNFFHRFKGIQREQTECYENFCSMRQKKLGARVFWAEPKEYVESLLGFRRFFTLENQISKALFEISNKPPAEWSKYKTTVVRREREQKVVNAVRSALLACAFQIQAACMRAALNHKIQATGSQLTKELQCEIWEHQPSGVHPWKVQLMNIHDEILAPSVPELAKPIEKTVTSFVERRKQTVPLLKMDWSLNLKSWAEK